MEHCLTVSKVLKDFAGVLLIFESFHFWLCHFDSISVFEYRQPPSRHKSILSWMKLIESSSSINTVDFKQANAASKFHHTEIKKWLQRLFAKTDNCFQPSSSKHIYKHMYIQRPQNSRHLFFQKQRWKH